MMSAEDVARFFTTTQANIARNPLLREPQREGHAKAVEYFAAAGRVLVIAPNVTIRDQLVAAFSPSSTKCFYKRVRALTDLTDGPFVAALDATANLSDLDDAHVAVTNIQQLTEGGRWLDRLDKDFFNLIIVDEGHHNVAATWQGVFDRFPNAKVISLTATPFRGDDQPVEGEVIYRYPIAEAMRNGFIKTIQASNVAPRELVFSYRGDDRVHTLEEVLRLKDKDWFSRGVALAEPCNVSIVDASIQWLEHLRQSGTGLRHQIVAAACSIDHARAIRRLYEERGYEAREIHSNIRDEDKDRIHRDLKDGKLDVVVQVQMLGEGFDHPPLSIAAVFRPYRSLNPYIQFVGRVMRTNVDQAPGHPDNRGIIVSHVGLNIDRHWDDFKTIDAEDQELVHSWLVSAPRTLPTAPDETRRKLLPDMIVTDELTLDTFLGDTFLEVSEDSMPDRVLETLRAQGIDPAAAGLNREILEVLIQTRQPAGPTGPKALPVQPQDHRKAQRARLNETAKTAAMRICQATGLSPAGRKISIKLGASNDLAAVIQLMHAEVNRFLDRPPRARRDLTIEQIEHALSSLETIADTVEADVRGRIG